jgi:hypothetical protein
MIKPSAGPGQVLTLALSMVAVSLAACVPTTPRLDAKFGSAVNTARFRQIVNPSAGRNTDPVKGVDGQAGDAMIDNYREVFVDPRPALTGGIINVGSGRPGSGGGGMRGR